ncbi:MAG: redoxin domain-containing protein [Armatimonadetes bacterium]|nr:redoxin domain-containing protein [Armatimonadota bacterium]
MKYTKAIVIASVAAASIAMLGNAPTTGGEAEIGKAAPTFSLTDSNGKAVNLGDFKGKVVVLEWTNDGCPFVVGHYQGGIQAMQKSYKKEGVVWLTIISSAEGKQGYADGKRANGLTKSRKASPSYVLLDPTGKVGHQYDAKTTPQMYVIDKAGVLRYDGAIDGSYSASAAKQKESDQFFTIALDSVLAGEKVKKAKTRPYGCSVKYK